MITKNYLKDLSKNKINILIIVLYTIIVIVTMFHHEIWRDEALAWVLVASSVMKDMLNEIVNGGHPFLWYSILFPFVKLNFNLFSLQIISVIIGVLSVIFFVFKAPFSSIIKSLFVFNAGMLYFLPIIARPYILISLLIFILAYLYPKRLNHPYKYVITLILISQTHCMMWGFFVVCSFFFLFEIVIKLYKDKNKQMLFIPFLLILYIIFMFIIYKPVFFNNVWAPNLRNEFFHFSFDNIFFFKDFFSLFITDYGINNIAFIFLFITICMLCILFFKYNKKLALVFLFSLIYILYIFLKVWSQGIIYQKIFLLILILIFCCWIILKEQEKITKFFKCLLYIFFIFLFFSPLSFFPIYDDVRNKMTNVKEICDYIKSKKIVNNTDGNVAIITDLNIENFLANKIDYFRIFVAEDGSMENLNECRNMKYIIVQDIYEYVFNDNNEFKNRYKKTLNYPINKLKYYNTGEYYSVWERQE